MYMFGFGLVWLGRGVGGLGVGGPSNPCKAG
jgi:hypothetical protein